MPLSASAASSSMLFHAFLLLAAMAMAMVVVSTTASSVVPVTDEQYRRDVNMTRFTNASMVDGDVNYETYHCFLCTGRHPLLSHMCPIYWDECHLECWDAIDPDAPAPPALPSAAAADHSMDTAPGNLECYVLKVYNSGRYVVVQRLNCAVVAPYACFLTCGGGELDDRKVTTTIQQQGSFALPSELCNSQVNALRAPQSSAAAGVVVPAGGVH